jgi:hypothetical protein
MAEHARPSEPVTTDRAHLEAENARLRDDLDYYRDRYSRAETALIGIGALVQFSNPDLSTG